MADLKINASVEGLETVKELEKSLESVDKNTKLSTKSIAGWTVGISAAIYAVEQIAKAGAEYLHNQEALNQSIVTTKDLQDALTDSFGMASASLLEYTGAWQAYREVLIEVSNLLDAVAGAEAIRAKARYEHLEWEKEYQQMLKENIKLEEKRERARERAAEKEARANINSQKLLTELEEKAQRAAEREAKEYEDKLKAIDASIDAINAETQAQVDNIEVKEKAVEVTDDLVESLNEQADATNKATEEIKTYSQVAPDGWEGSASYVSWQNLQQGVGYMSTNMKQPTSQLERYLREIAASTRDTNNAVRGY